MSMAAGEYVSVSSQGDAEKADIARERHELKTQPDHELEALTQIYEGRGLERGLAAEVADRKSVVKGKRVSVGVDLGGRRIIQKKKTLPHKECSKTYIHL